jgi:hypothetical protein
MTAYFILDLTVHDPVRCEDYIALAAAEIAP